MADSRVPAQQEVPILAEDPVSDDDAPGIINQDPPVARSVPVQVPPPKRLQERHDPDLHNPLNTNLRKVFIKHNVPSTSYVAC